MSAESTVPDPIARAPVATETPERVPDREPVPLESLAGFGKLLVGVCCWQIVGSIGWRDMVVAKVTKTRVRLERAGSRRGCWVPRGLKVWPRDPYKHGKDKPRWVYHGGYKAKS